FIRGYETNGSECASPSRSIKNECRVLFLQQFLFYRFLVPIAFQQTNRPVPVVYSLNTEFQLCNSEKAFLMNPASADVSMAEMDYKGAFSIGQTLYGRVLWNPEQNLNTAYKVQLEKVFLCTGQDGYVPFFDPTGTLYNEGPQYGCIQPNKNLRHRFLLLV
ncbi:hypothetical protein JZ751_012410, partial [Albula glossodonta]